MTYYTIQLSHLFYILLIFVKVVGRAIASLIRISLNSVSVKKPACIDLMCPLCVIYETHVFLT